MVGVAGVGDGVRGEGCSGVLYHLYGRWFEMDIVMEGLKLRRDNRTHFDMRSKIHGFVQSFYHFYAKSKCRL